ncbi:MAG: hypothetical protein IT530_06550 [Burkholderiales bacterium]|nr:hypothetical protein [Burkholderiales bacterium]
MQISGRGALPGLTLDFVVRPGELELVESRYKERSSAIADVLLGLAAAGSGSVRFLGRAWRDLNRREAFELRREIGRVQGRGNWMDARSVMDNLLLPARHHTVVPERELRERACLLAQQFGLPGLPLLLPGECAPEDLERAACVRAFLGRPALVVLEHPMAFEDSGLLAPLMNAILGSLEQVMSDLGRSSPELPKITRDVSTATASVPVLLGATQQTLAELEALLRQLRGHWLLGGDEADPQPAQPRLAPREVRP